MITRVFFNPKKNPALADAIAQTKARPSKLLTPPEFPEIMMGHVHLVANGKGLYVYQTQDELPTQNELPKLPAALDDLKVHHVKLHIRVEVTPDVGLIALDHYVSQTDSRCRASVTERKRGRNNGSKYRERRIIVRGPSLKKAFAYQLDIRRGYQGTDRLLWHEEAVAES